MVVSMGMRGESIECKLGMDVELGILLSSLLVWGIVGGRGCAKIKMTNDKRYHE